MAPTPPCARHQTRRAAVSAGVRGGQGKNYGGRRCARRPKNLSAPGLKPFACKAERLEQRSRARWA